MGPSERYLVWRLMTPDCALEKLGVVAIRAGIVWELPWHDEKGMERDAIEHTIELDPGEPQPNSLGHPAILLDDLGRHDEINSSSIHAETILENGPE